MSKAVRAIVMTKDNLLVMYRDKQGSRYFTLVGGGVHDNETPEEALVREVQEETGLRVTRKELVYIEDHVKPFTSQMIYLCEVETYQAVGLEEYSEEAMLNKLGMNIHKPMWVSITGFKNLAFRTPALQNAIVKAMKSGFPSIPEHI